MNYVETDEPRSTTDIIALRIVSKRPEGFPEAFRDLVKSQGLDRTMNLVLDRDQQTVFVDRKEASCVIVHLLVQVADSFVESKHGH